VLTKNRHKENLIFISSNPFRIIAAIKAGYLTIPVIQFEVSYQEDYQLCLVEHYILKIRHLKDMKKRLREDFKFLVKKPIKDNGKKQQSEVCNDGASVRSVRSRRDGGIKGDALCFDVASVGSFGFKKQK